MGTGGQSDPAAALPTPLPLVIVIPILSHCAFMPMLRGDLYLYHKHAVNLELWKGSNMDNECRYSVEALSGEDTLLHCTFISVYFRIILQTNN